MLLDTKPFRFAYSDDQIRSIFVEPLYRGLIGSRQFRRLRYVSFLGVFEYIVRAGSLKGNFIHTRFNHSIGVAALGLQFARAINATKEVEQDLVIHSLLHDIGHLPFSHSVEGVFHSRFQIDHHIVLQNILDRQPGYSNEIPDLLARYSYDPARIKFGVSAAPEAVTGPFNLDTLEGITRVYSSVAHSVRYPPARIMERILLENSETYKDLFWADKKEAYDKLINSPWIAASDILSSLYLSELPELKAEYHLLDDRQFMEALPDFALLLSQIRIYLGEHGTALPPVPRRRHFFIDTNENLTSDQRYKSKKESAPCNLDSWRRVLSFVRSYSEPFADNELLFPDAVHNR